MNQQLSDKTRPVGPEPLVEVVPLGKLSQTATGVAAGNLQALLGLDALVVEPWPEPDYALIPSRGQYDATPILEALSADQSALPLRLGLTNHDLCLPFLSYVFGEAQVGGRAAVVSLHRLRSSPDGGQAPRDVILERLAKVAMHEMAHVVGLVHCRSQACLMNFCETLASLDRLSPIMCPQCKNHLSHCLRAMASGRP